MELLDFLNGLIKLEVGFSLNPELKTGDIFIGGKKVEIKGDIYMNFNIYADGQNLEVLKSKVEQIKNSARNAIERDEDLKKIIEKSKPAQAVSTGANLLAMNILRNGPYFKDLSGKAPFKSVTDYKTITKAIEMGDTKLEFEMLETEGTATLEFP